MDSKFLEFEKPIAEIEARREELQYIADDSEGGLSSEALKLDLQSKTLIKKIFISLSDW